MRREGRYGFTMLELMIVIAIIVILASLLLPALNKAKDASRKAGCQSNLKQLANGAFIYATDFNSWGPINTNNGSGHVYSWNSVNGYLIQQNTMQAKNLVCPGTKPPFSDNASYYAGKISPGGDRVYSSYILSFGRGSRTSADWFGWNSSGIPLSEDSLTRAQCPNIGMLGKTVQNMYIDTPSRQPMAGDIASRDGYVVAFGLTAPTFPMAHVTGANNAFMDGHISWTARTNFIYSINYYYEYARIFWNNK